MAKHFLEGMEVTRRTEGKGRGRMPDLLGGNNRNTSRAAKFGEAISNELWIKATTIGIEEDNSVGIGDSFDQLPGLELLNLGHEDVW